MTGEQVVYTYDGFGNLTDQIVTAGTAPTMSTTYNAANNGNACADANGNINSISPCGGYIYTNYETIGSGYEYDVENRIVAVPGTTNYAYAPGNKRVWRGNSGYNSQTGTNALLLDEITFWSVTGQKLATYNVQGDPSIVSVTSGTPSITVMLATSNYYFGRKLIKNAYGYLGTDRLGSVGHFYPWGQEKPSATTNGTEKFTGYFRDSETGNDYAVNRYHQPGMGRFLTVDSAMPRPSDPGSLIERDSLSSHTR